MHKSISPLPKIQLLTAPTCSLTTKTDYFYIPICTVYKFVVKMRKIVMSRNSSLFYFFYRVFLTLCLCWNWSEEHQKHNRNKNEWNRVIVMSLGIINRKTGWNVNCKIFTVYDFLSIMEMILSGFWLLLTFHGRKKNFWFIS